MNCRRCGSSLDVGKVLVSSTVWWSPTRRPFLPMHAACAGMKLNRGGYLGRPLSIDGGRCQNCRVIVVSPSEACKHDPERGYIFPRASLRWWGGPGDFEPTFWYPIASRSKQGGACEVVLRRGFVLHTWRTACPASRCEPCGWVDFEYGRGAA